MPESTRHRPHSADCTAAQVFAERSLKEGGQALPIDPDKSGTSAGVRAHRIKDFEDYRRIAVIGTGRFAQLLAEALERFHDVVAFAEPFAVPEGISLGGRKLVSTDLLHLLEVDAVIMAEGGVGQGEEMLPRNWNPSIPIVEATQVFDRLLVFGAGAGGRKVWEVIPRKASILAFVDNDVNKSGSQIEGVPVILPESVSQHDYRYILVASMYRDEIESQLKQLGIPERRVLSIDPTRRPRVRSVSRRKELLKEARMFWPELLEEDLKRAWSFAVHCADVALLDFARESLAVGVIMAAAGARVLAFGAPSALHGATALGVNAISTSFRPEDANAFSACIVLGPKGISSITGSWQPGQRLIAPRQLNLGEYHRQTANLSFWYAPPRQWLSIPKIY